MNDEDKSCNKTCEYYVSKFTNLKNLNLNLFIIFSTEIALQILLDD